MVVNIYLYPNSFIISYSFKLIWQAGNYLLHIYCTKSYKFIFRFPSIFSVKEIKAIEIKYTFYKLISWFEVCKYKSNNWTTLKNMLKKF